jgi:hypothetical protein
MANTCVHLFLAFRHVTPSSGLPDAPVLARVDVQAVGMPLGLQVLREPSRIICTKTTEDVTVEGVNRKHHAGLLRKSAVLLGHLLAPPDRERTALLGDGRVYTRFLEKYPAMSIRECPEAGFGV